MEASAAEGACTCALRLMRPTTVERESTRGAAASAEDVKMAACWPFHEVLMASSTSPTSEKLATGTTGPNCSSSWRRRAEVGQKEAIGGTTRTRWGVARGKKCAADARDVEGGEARKMGTEMRGRQRTCSS